MAVFVSGKSAGKLCFYAHWNLKHPQIVIKENDSQLSNGLMVRNKKIQKTKKLRSCFLADDKNDILFQGFKNQVDVFIFNL